jgi:predicted ATPase/DNA-binding winged helix-turn-helix (wHTH) protein
MGASHAERQRFALEGISKLSRPLAMMGDWPVTCGAEPPASLAFERFRVLPHRRELVADGQLVKLGGRAFDVLMALIEACGAIVSKDALMTRVWPDRVVEENNLQTQIVALRKALGADRELIRTVSGRGYQFIGEVRMLSTTLDERVNAKMTTARAQPALPPSNLPEPLSELIGRDHSMREILNLFAANRLVTLTGAGGIGKTRLALAVARELLPQFADGVWLAELGSVSDPNLVPAAVTVVAGLEFGTGPVSPKQAAGALSGKGLLLVLDNCEHVIGAAAVMADALLRANPAARVIATSREPLNMEGERVYPVPPLAVPAVNGQEQDDYLRHGALRLFIERAEASAPVFATNRCVAAITAICRRLDGIPLAIELAAARIATLGAEPLEGPFDRIFPLLAGARRTAPPRHQSLRATLDWSYELLVERERMILRRLAIFPADFTLEMATAMVADPDIAASEVAIGLADLVSKSLVGLKANNDVVHYALLNTTRAYALEKLSESGEREWLAGRLAEYRRNLFELVKAEPEPLSRLVAGPQSQTCARRWAPHFDRAPTRRSA